MQNLHGNVAFLVFYYGNSKWTKKSSSYFVQLQFQGPWTCHEPWTCVNPLRLANSHNPNKTVSQFLAFTFFLHIYFFPYWNQLVIGRKK